jgi:alkaline phosphatase D
LVLLIGETPAVGQPTVQLGRAPAPVIATGDVTAHSAVLWAQAEQPGTLRLDLIEANGNGSEPQRFDREVTAESDFSVKVEVSGLRPGTLYRWRAAVLGPAADEPVSEAEPSAEGRVSPTGAGVDAAVAAESGADAPGHASPRPISAEATSADGGEEGVEGIAGEPALGQFRTAPEPYEAVPVRFTWGGDLAGQNVCRDTERGFEILGAIRDSAPDFFVGLGDMIYADGLCEAVGRYGNAQIPASFGKATDLAGYRAHWRYSRADPGLRRLLAETAYYAVWDDHEVVNDFGPLHDTRDHPPYRSGEHLLPIGLAAMLEQNPIREDPLTPKRLYRGFRWGQHLELLLLDTRQYRDANTAPDSAERPKTLLGREQLTWLEHRLESSDATWIVVASSVPLSVPTGWPPEGGRDGWADLGGTGGFEQELRRILADAAANGRDKLLFIAADVHFGAGFRYRPFPDRPKFVVHELIAGPLSAAVGSIQEYDPDLGTERMFLHAPESRAAVGDYAEARRWFSFGELRVDAAGELTATLRGVDGEPLYSLRLSPASATRLAEAPGLD